MFDIRPFRPPPFFIVPLERYRRARRVEWSKGPFEDGDVVCVVEHDPTVVLAEFQVRGARYEQVIVGPRLA